MLRWVLASQESLFSAMNTVSAFTIRPAFHSVSWDFDLSCKQIQNQLLSGSVEKWKACTRQFSPRDPETDHDTVWLFPGWNDFPSTRSLSIKVSWCTGQLTRCGSDVWEMVFALRGEHLLHVENTWKLGLMRNHSWQRIHFDPVFLWCRFHPLWVLQWSLG